MVRLHKFSNYPVLGLRDSRIGSSFAIWERFFQTIGGSFFRLYASHNVHGSDNCFDKAPKAGWKKNEGKTPADRAKMRGHEELAEMVESWRSRSGAKGGEC